MTARGDDRDTLKAAASRLAGEPVTALEPAGHGANSHAFRLTTPTRALALKVYPQRMGDTRDRLDVEWRALGFLAAAGIRAVPTIIARDDAGRLLLMEWVEGPIVRQHTAADLDAAIGFMTDIFATSDRPGADAFPLASEACLSPSEIVRQIERRLPEFASHPLLETFLADHFTPRFADARARLAATNMADTVLAPDLRRLIPADFGFHNAIRAADGRLRFIDFDYFGWDDPVKLTADFVLHPAMSLSASDKQTVVNRLAAACPRDAGFRDRLAITKPLYALRWTLILLNVFRRDRAGELPADAEARRSRLETQIGKARAMAQDSGI